MEQRDIIAFFDRCAPAWDAEMIRDEEVIRCILDTAGISPGKRVLDVACGTGVLFGDYLSRGAVITGIDISPAMVEIARQKFPDTELLCGDAEALQPGSLFDCVMLYNAFPHFSDPQRLLQRLVSFLRPGGRLSIAHGMSRDAVNRLHADSAAPVSLPLPAAQTVAAWLAPFVDVDTVVSDARMYQIAGNKTPGRV